MVSNIIFVRQLLFATMKGFRVQRRAMVMTIMFTDLLYVQHGLRPEAHHVDVHQITIKSIVRA